MIIPIVEDLQNGMARIPEIITPGKVEKYD